MLQAELRILGGKHQGKMIPLSTKKFLVGREQDCHLRPNSDLVSRHHCVFSIDEYAVRLRDLGSTNGTRVNGEALRGEAILKAGDQIGIGKMELELVVRQTANIATMATVRGSSGSSAEMDIVPGGPTIEIPSYTPDSPSESSETSFEMPVQVNQSTQQTSTSLANDTAILPGAVANPYPGYPQMVPQGYPAMMPAGYPMAQGYPGQPMAYPQYPPGYGQPVYPNMPNYPAQMPVAGYAPQPGPAAATPVPAAADTMAVKLPPPEMTGARDPQAVPGSGGGAAAAGPKAAEEKPSTSAADIIKNYMQRRTR